jgi:hypothetical protein
MKHLIYIILFLAFLSSSTKAQKIELTKNDSLNIERSQKLAKKILGSKQGYTRYLIFAIGDELLFIYDSANVYNLSFVSEKFNYTTQQKEFSYGDTKQVDLNHKPLCKFWFRRKACSPLFAYTGNQNVSSHPNYMYFLMKDGASKICEFNLPVQDNVSSSSAVKIPLNQKLLNYLLGELLPYIAKRAAIKS